MAIEPHSNTSKLMEKLSELLAEGADLNHEELKGLLGGEDNKHYHLKEAELQKLLKLLTVLLPNGDEEYPKVDHEKLSNLLGGKANEHYHLTNDELQKLVKLLAVLLPDGDETYPEIDHEKLNNLKGGNRSGHYHLTEDELAQLTRLLGTLFDGTGTNVHISHEDDLADLLGGAASGHYHLTRAQLTKLENLSETPTGTAVEVINNLTSTSVTAALSANQGRVLNSKINNKLDATAVNSESWTFTLEDNSTVTKKVMLSAV